MGRFARRTSKEGLVIRPDGSSSDREFHEEILAASDGAKAQEVTRAWLSEQGWTDADIDAWLEKPIPATARCDGHKWCRPTPHSRAMRANGAASWA
jgi:hypothetical protein